MKSHLFVFDMDGVILDSMPTLTDLAVGIMTSLYNIKEDDAHSQYSMTIGAPFRDQLAQIFPGKDKENQQAASLYSRTHLAIAPLFKEHPLAEMIFKTLGSLGIGTALVSSTHRQILLRTKAATLPFHFIGGWQPDIYGEFTKSNQVKKAMSNHWIQPADTILFGDSLSDKNIARDLHIGFSYVKTPEHFPMAVTLALSRIQAIPHE